MGTFHSATSINQVHKDAAYCYRCSVVLLDITMSCAKMAECKRCCLGCVLGRTQGKESCIRWGTRSPRGRGSFGACDVAFHKNSLTTC